VEPSEGNESCVQRGFLGYSSYKLWGVLVAFCYALYTSVGTHRQLRCGICRCVRGGVGDSVVHDVLLSCDLTKHVELVASDGRHSPSVLIRDELFFFSDFL
jgi:hypothetical protein